MKSSLPFTFLCDLVGFFRFFFFAIHLSPFLNIQLNLPCCNYIIPLFLVVVNDFIILFLKNRSQF
jgi:hypothetical protein